MPANDAPDALHPLAGLAPRAAVHHLDAFLGDQAAEHGEQPERPAVAA